MAKISNTSAYPNLATPVATDYLILTDQSDNFCEPTRGGWSGIAPLK